MKLLYLTFLLLLAASGVYAQDIITQHDSTRIEAKIIEITPLEIRYKLFDNLDGPFFVLDRKDVHRIAFPNGKVMVMSPSKRPNPDAGQVDYVAPVKAKKPELLDYQSRTGVERARMFEAGAQEAEHFYTGTSPMVGTAVATFFGAGVVGLLVGGISYLTPPDVDMQTTSSPALKTDPDFRAGYQKKAHKKKKKKIAAGFGIGIGALILLVAVTSN